MKVRVTVRIRDVLIWRRCHTGKAKRGGHGLYVYTEFVKRFESSNSPTAEQADIHQFHQYFLKVIYIS